MTVPDSLSALHDSLVQKEWATFASLADAFVIAWQPQRAAMESDDDFVHEPLMAVLVSVLNNAVCGLETRWHALRLGCLMARADANAPALLRVGVVAAALRVLTDVSAEPDAYGGGCGGDAEAEAEARVEVSLALLQNVAYLTEGVSSILREGGVGVVLGAMATHIASAPIQRNGLGVLWNLCDSDEHWVAFLSVGRAMVSTLLAALEAHPHDEKVEEKVVDMLWDFSSTGDGQGAEPPKP